MLEMKERESEPEDEDGREVLGSVRRGCSREKGREKRHGKIQEENVEAL